MTAALLVQVTRDDFSDPEPVGGVQYIKGTTTQGPVRFWVDQELNHHISKLLFQVSTATVEIPLGHIDGAV
jgi:hypothetical protein